MRLEEFFTACKDNDLEAIKTLTPSFDLNTTRFEVTNHTDLSPLLELLLSLGATVSSYDGYHISEFLRRRQIHPSYKDFFQTHGFDVWELCVEEENKQIEALLEQERNESMK